MARQFARWFGVIYILVGILGFIPGVNIMRMPEMGITAATSYGYLLGLFPVNLVHNCVHLAIGIWGVTSAGTFANARTYARSLAVILGVLTIAGFFPGLNTLFGLAPLFGNDIWLHALSAIAAAYVGWGAPQETATA
jgi:uncharacterized protein DUF4383